MLKLLFSIFPAFLAAIMLVFTPVMTAHAMIGDKITIRQENEMGRNFDKLIRSQMPMVGDTYITDYVADLVNRIVLAKRPMPFRIQSAVVANPILNAFAIPGGFIYIFTGLIQEVNNESELVGVIAHELAHVSQRHVASRIEKQATVGLLSTAGTLAAVFLGVAGGSGSAKAAQALMMGSQGLATAAMLQYSQDDEREADHVGMNSLVKAGYDPHGMPATFDILMKNRWFDNGSEMPTYLSTHPGLSERITYLNDRIQRMPETFQTRKDDNTKLKRIQVLVRSKMSPATSALAYYTNKNRNEFGPMDYVGLGNVQERLKNRAEAAESFSKALHLDGEDPLVAREAGIFYYKSGDHTKAFKYLQKAVSQNKRDALGMFYLARLQADTKDTVHAVINMRKVLEIVPDDPEVFQHLGMILGESGNTFEGNLNLAYAALYSNDRRKADYYAAQAAQAATTDAQKAKLKELNDVVKDRSNPGQ